MCYLESQSVSCSLGPHGLYTARLLCPWDSPGKNTGVGSLLREIFLIQGLISGLPHCRQILHYLSHQDLGSPTLQADSSLSEPPGKPQNIYSVALGLSCSMWTLLPWPGIEPGLPALGEQSLNHWTTRKSTRWKSPGCSNDGIVQARILEWVVIPSSRGLSWAQVLCSAGGFFTIWAAKKSRVTLVSYSRPESEELWSDRSGDRGSERFEWRGWLKHRVRIKLRPIGSKAKMLLSCWPVDPDSKTHDVTVTAVTSHRKANSSRSNNYNIFSYPWSTHLLPHLRHRNTFEISFLNAQTQLFTDTEV